MSEPKALWMDAMALTTVIFAVCATLSTFKGGSYSTRSVICQEQASDQWNFYQAKSIRESLYTVQKENLELQLAVLPRNTPPDTVGRYRETLALTEAAIAKYDAQKKGIEEAAHALEKQRDEAQRHGKPFGIAVIFLQIAILLSSIAGLFKRREIWLVAMPVGLIGLVCFFDGFLLFLP